MGRRHRRGHKGSDAMLGEETREGDQRGWVGIHHIIPDAAMNMHIDKTGQNHAADGIQRRRLRRRPIWPNAVNTSLVHFKLSQRKSRQYSHPSGPGLTFCANSAGSAPLQIDKVSMECLFILI